MTPQERKVMELALEALNDMACWQEGREVDMGFDEPYAADTSRKAITAIKEALAHPEQYPHIAISPKIVGYVAPRPTWVGLTDEEIEEIENEYIVDYRIPAGSAWNFAKDIEFKLKQKNGYAEEKNNG